MRGGRQLEFGQKRKANCHQTKPVLVNTSVGGHRYLKLTYGLKSRGDKFIRDIGECFQTGVTRERNFGQ